MVTRKPSAGGPPPLDTSAQSHAGHQNTNNANPPYPTSPVQTQTALDRSKTIHSASSVYSPNLHDSPAFDLIGMDEARQRPRRDSDVSSHGTWADSEDEEDRDEADMPKPLQIRASQDLRDQRYQHEQQQSEQQPAQGPDSQQVSREELPAILRPGASDTSRRISQESRRPEEEPVPNPWAAQSSSHATNHAPPSNNPYRPYRQPNGHAENDLQSAWQPQPQQPQKAPPAPPVELPTVQTPANEFSKLSFSDHGHEGEQRPDQTSTVLPESQQQGQTDNLSSNNPWRRPSQDEAQQQPQQDASSQFAEQLFEAPSQPPQQQQEYAPPPGPAPKSAPSEPSTSLLDQDEPMGQIRPATEQHRPENIMTAPLPVGSSTDAGPETPGTQARRQRSEHYSIKHINWFSHTSGSMQRSPILTQNANGPCPLLALVNALVLSTPPGLETALLETLRSREQVSLGLLLDAVFDELMSGRRGDTAHELPDVGELYGFLLTLHTGMNVNPRFITPASAPRGSLDLSPPDKTGLHPSERAQTKAGAFEETKEMRLYSTFSVPLIHGWTPPRDTPAYQAMERSAPTFEEAQNIQFLESELTDKQRAEGLSAGEQQTLQDIQTIKSFLNSWPTQLTDYGLETISSSLQLGQIAILFRNDHFSTLYKEPGRGALMTLVTDSGYGSHDEIVWESLVDVNGAASEYFSGDFRSVSHGSTGGPSAMVGSMASAHLPRSSAGVAESGPPLPGARPASGHENPPPRDTSDGEGATAQRTLSEQEDHDMALALQLQEEEEDQQRQAEERRRREQELSERYLSSSSPDGPRPPIPPRRSNNATSNRSSGPTPSGRPPVRRRSDENGDGSAPPPTYEQSASDRPYRPAGATASSGLQQGNPLNAYDALRAQQQQQQQGGSPSIANGRRQSQQGGVGGRIRRRSGQMMPGGMPAQSSGGSTVPPGAYAPQQQTAGGGRTQGAAGVRDAEERCVVM
ncbi:hypothetical protein KC349_g4336 [Hortaea werneckii]|nr:hypothetical protein KC349_g4336 [Hortaea werneckii]